MRPIVTGTKYAPVDDGRKKCHGCKSMLPFSAFSKCSTGRAGLQARCKRCKKEAEQADPSRSRKRSARYAGRYPERNIWRALKQRRETMPREQFIEWHQAQPKVCVYCHIPEDAAIDRTGHRLNIDRKDGALGYVEGNIALACLHCNLVKSGFLTHEEMLVIGIQYMKPKWTGIPYDPAHDALVKAVQDALEMLRNRPGAEAAWNKLTTALAEEGKQ